MGDIYSLCGDWGNMKFHHIPRSSFEIWLNKYKVDKSIRTETRIDQEFIELSFILSRSALISMKHFGVFNLDPFQFNLIYAPFIDSRVEFDPGDEMITIDFHLKRKKIEEMAEAFPELLNPLLGCIVKKKPYAVFPVNGYASEKMIEDLMKIMDIIFDQKTSETDPEILEGMIGELLYVVLSSREHLVIPRLSLVERRKMIDIKKRLHYMSDKAIEIPELVKEAGLCRTYFDLAFKELSNMSIYRYSLKCKMERAYQLFSEGNGNNVSEIAYLLGYKSVQSFSKAFEKWFGHRPMSLRANNKLVAGSY